MNNRGFAIYPVGLVIVVIISCVLLVNALSAKFNMPQQIGEIQQTVLQSTADMRIAETYLKRIADYSSEESIHDLANHPSLRTLCPFGSLRSSDSRRVPLTCPIINNPREPRDICIPDLFSAYQTIFNENIQDHIRRYNGKQNVVRLPERGYEVMFMQNTSAVISTKPATITLRNTEGQTQGYATFRPAFQTYLSSQHFFTHTYPNFIQEELKDVTIFCYDAEDRESCIEETTLARSGQHYTQISNETYILYYPSHPTYCFGVNLPGTNIAPKP